MFDFFRDMVLEARGIDSEAAAEQRKGKKEPEHRERFIFSRSTKGIIFILGILYLVMGGMQIVVMKGQDGIALFMLQFVLLSILDISALVCLLLRNKKAEIAALILVIVFVVMKYLTTMSGALYK